MNQEKAQEIISLYRKLNERDDTFKERDFENYNELFRTDKIAQHLDILNEYEDKTLEDVVNPEYEFKTRYLPRYLEAKLAVKTENGYKLHFEFIDYIFYYLLKYYKNGIELFLETLSQRFPFYEVKSKGTFEIPYRDYQNFFEQLANDEIKNAVRFLVRTVTNTIITDNDLFTTSIDVNLIKCYIKNLKKYN
ncbi:hypothetical protein PG279_10005 [Riemerella anatipestifer]|nr:hypothetical protein [Riemerella anatipestifer]